MATVVGSRWSVRSRGHVDHHGPGRRGVPLPDLVATSQAIRRDHGWEHDLGSPHATREALADAVRADIAVHGPAAVVALAVSHADCEDLADRIRTRLRAAGHIHGPELAGPAWGNGERRYAAGDRLLVHGTLRSEGQRLRNGSVVTITGVAADGLHAVDQHGVNVRLPQEFIAGHRTDGSPNCSHAWARTVTKATQTVFA